MRQIFKNFLEEKALFNFDLKAVLFDMDGVLYNSMPFHAKAWQEVMQEYRVEFAEHEAYLHEGRTADSTIQLLFDRQFSREASRNEINEIYGRKTDLFTKYNDGSTIPYAKEFIEKVKEEGLKVVLVTGSGQDSLLNKLGVSFPYTFDHNNMITANDVVNGKPNPEPFIRGLNIAGGLKNNEAIVIENAPLGVEAASKAGIFTIAVNTGPLANEVLLDAGANIVFDSMKDLYDNWNEILDIVKIVNVNKTSV